MWRPIIDLSTLNTYIASQRFHMETPQSVLRSIRPGDWMISLDLQDAYLQVPVHPESRRYLRFTVGGVSYQFGVLCFGLTTAPQVFTRLMAPISAILHHYGIRMLRYLDDWLILAESRTTCLQARDRLLQVCEELGLQVNLRKSSLIPSQDMTYLGMQIQSVRFIAKPTETRVANLLKIIEEFLSSPAPPSSSLASSSGPPFVPYSSGKGWDVKDAISPDSPQVQVGLSRLIASHSLGSSMSGGSFMVVLGDSRKRGCRSFPPCARLELLFRRVRRRLGRHRRGTLSVRSLDSKPKGILHQPQGDDGSAERPLRVQLSLQRQDDRSLLRQCHDSRLSQAIGRHEVSGPVPQSEGDSPVGRIHEDHATSPVHPGVSQHESGSSQSAQPGDRIGVDTTPGGGPGSSLPVAGDHRPVRDFADSKAPSVLCSSVGTQNSGGGCIPPALGQSQAYAFPPITIIKRVLLKLRASHNCDLTLIAPSWPQREWFPDLLELLSDIPIELPKHRDLLRQPHFHRFHENLPVLCLTAWRLSSNSPVRPASLIQWLAILPSVGENLLD